MLPFSFITSPGSTQGLYMWCIARSRLMFWRGRDGAGRGRLHEGAHHNPLALGVNGESTDNRQLNQSVYDQNGNPEAIQR